MRTPVRAPRANALIERFHCSFMVTAVDYGTPGTKDQFGLQLKDPSGNVVSALAFSPITLGGGNIVVPHG